jgi:hypothetical protein
MADGEGKGEELRAKRDERKNRLAVVGDMRPGSLVERYRRCLPTTRPAPTGQKRCGDPGIGRVRSACKGKRRSPDEVLEARPGPQRRRPSAAEHQRPRQPPDLVLRGQCGRTCPISGRLAEAHGNGARPRKDTS